MPLILLALLNPINDITTDFERPPQFKEIAQLEEVKTKDFSYPTRFIDVQKKLHPEVQPLTVHQPASEVFSQALKQVEEKGWRLISSSPDELRIEAVAETSLMKFKDDIVIEIRNAPEGAEVHMRSRSRVGKSDLGANAKRITQFLQAWPK